MEIEGKIIQVYETVTGTSANGNEWAKKGYVLVTSDQYPRKIKFDVFGVDKVNQVTANPGDEVTVSCDLESREFPEDSGKWYTDVRAWTIVSKSQPEAVPAAQAAVPDPFAPDGGKLPF